MKKFVIVFTSLMILLAIFLAQIGSISASADPGIDAGTPEVRYSTRSDASPRLVDIPPRDPRWASLIVIPRKMLPNRPGEPGAPVTDPVLSDPPVTNAGSTLLSFEGVNNVNGVLPPDTNGDVGPNHYVQMVNLAFAIYDKNGTKLYGPANTNTLWSGFGGYCESTNDGDPIVLYDHLADRWMMSQFALPNYPRGPFIQCIAISQTPDPTGAWFRYEFTISTRKMNDYPHFGVWPDGYYMSMNQFQIGNWAGQGAVVFERDKMLLGQTARMIYFDLYGTDPNLGGMLPSDLDGATLPPSGTPNFFMEIDDDAWGYSPDQVQIWEFKTDWVNTANSKFTKKVALPVAAFESDMCGGSRNCIPQPGGGYKVDALSDRLMYRLQYRNFGGYQTLIANHTVDVDGTDHAGLRWYELRNSGSGWSIYQQSTFSPDANHRWVGSAAMNGQGEIALGYSVSSTSVYPSIYFTGRTPSDPLGQMTLGEGVIINGTGNQNHSSGRWGDYASMSVDPVDDCTFWFTTEYYTIPGGGTNGAAWQTRIGHIQLTNCSTPPPPVDNPPTVSITNPSEGATVSGSVNITANASDDKGVTQVEFFVDNISLGKDNNGTDGWSISWDTNTTSDGAHSLKAIATDTINQTGQDTNNITVSNTVSQTMHVGDLDGTKSGRFRWTATVTITVHDANHVALSGVTVQGDWSIGGTSSCTTGSNGTCQVSKSSIPSTTSSVTFNVTSLSKSGVTYQPISNHDPETDSNGTAITISK